MNAENRETPCRCPVRPYGPSMASGSVWETRRLEEWQRMHGHHAYAKARDALANALNVAETSVMHDQQRNAGAAVLDMVADVFGMPRPGEVTPEPPAVPASCEEDCCLPK